MNQKYIDMIYSENHLEHHGVLGQKWGVENGPPYPLGRDVQSMLSNGASYHSIKKALRSDYKAEKKELKNTVVNEEKRYMNTLNYERRKNDEAWNKFLNDDPRRIAEDYQYNKNINGRIARDLRKDQIKDLQSRKEAEEDRYATAIDNATKRNDEAWDKYADSMKAAKENYKSEMKELKDATKNERLNEALKIAGVAAGVAAVAGVSYLAAKEISNKLSNKLDKNDRKDILSNYLNKFNRGNIAEKIAKDKTSAREWHDGARDEHRTSRVITNKLYDLNTAENIKDTYQKRLSELDKLQDHVNDSGIRSINAKKDLQDSKSIRDKAAANLLRKYDVNGYKDEIGYFDSKFDENTKPIKQPQVDRASIGRAQVGRASVDRKSNNKKSKR